MQFVFGILAIVIVLELFSAGNGANIPYQNRGYIIDIPLRLIRGNKQWSENYYRQEPDTNNNPTNPVHQYRAIKKSPNYLGYKDKPSTYHAALPREHYSKQESGQIHRNSSFLVSFWYPNNDNRPSDNYFTNLVQYGNRYPSQDLNQPHLSAVYYHPQTTGYNPVSPRKEHQLDERPGYHTETQDYPPSANHLLSIDYNLQPPPPSPERYHSPIHRKSIYHHPQSGAAPSFPPTELRLGAPPPFPTHPGIPRPPPPPIRLGESPLQQPTHLRVMSLMPFLTHPGIPQPQPPHREVAPPSPPPHLEVAPPPPHRRVAPPSPAPHPEVAEGKTALSIYQHMPTTFWKTTGYFRKDRTKRSIRDEDDHLLDLELNEDHLYDWEFEEEEYVDAENGDKEEGHGIHDSTDVHERKKRWASDTGEDNGDCQDCATSNESVGEEEYNADPWNNADNDSDESRQTETWNSGNNNNDYTWNNDENNDDYTWNNDENNDSGGSTQTGTWSNDDNNNSGETSQTDTWSNDDNNDEYSWNNDDTLNNDDDETDSTGNTDDNDYAAEVSYTPAVQKPRPHPPPPEHNRQIAYPRRPGPEHGPLSRHPQSNQPIPQPKPHPPKPHQLQNWPGSVHDRRPNPRSPKSNPPQRRPVPLNDPSPGHSNPDHTLPIPPAPPRHPKSPSYPSEHLQYDWDYEECED